MTAVESLKNAARSAVFYQDARNLLLVVNLSHWTRSANASESTDDAVGSIPFWSETVFRSPTDFNRVGSEINRTLIG